MKGSLGIALLALALAARADAGDHGGKLPWKKDYAAGLREAKQSGKPVALYFTRDG